ncbi:MAG: 2'-5' RNA ligase, partial [Clostridia bacterium]|nr:2'-5' RNA ligase [Clostridia bacterium]
MFWDIVQPYLDRGLVSCQRHPDWPDLAIFNYTPKCELGRHWDNVTRICRGLVVDLAQDRVVARPFPKFFGLWELPALGINLPPGDPEVTVKLDGVLGISYRTPDGALRWATRGSFVSPQSKVAERMWEGRRLPPPGLTLLCE